MKATTAEISRCVLLVWVKLGEFYSFVCSVLAKCTLYKVFMGLEYYFIADEYLDFQYQNC